MTKSRDQRKQKQTVLVRLDVEDHGVLTAASVASETSIQRLIEPVLKGGSTSDGPTRKRCA